jgi:hypothetical protein
MHDQAREVAREHIRRAARRAGDPQPDISALAGIQSVKRGRCECGRVGALFPLSDAQGTRFLCVECVRGDLFLGEE